MIADISSASAARRYSKPSPEGKSRPGMISLDRVNELPDFCTLLVHIGQVLFIKLLVDMKFLLGQVFLPEVNVGLAEPVMGVGNVRVEAQGLEIFRHRVFVAALLGVQVSELKRRLAESGIEGRSFLQEGLDLVEQCDGAFRPLALPQTHPIVIGGSRVTGLALGEAREVRDDLVGLAR